MAGMKFLSDGLSPCFLSFKGMSCMKEKDVERKLKIEVEKAGGLCVKFISPGLSGVPDRIVLFPGGKIAFIELKAPGERVRPLQKVMIEKIRSLGFRVEVIDSKEAAKEFVQSTKKTEKESIKSRNGKEEVEDRGEKRKRGEAE